MKKKITIITCLIDGTLWGIPHSTGIYDGEWVDKLYRGFERNTSLPFNLICLVDKEYSITTPVQQIPLLTQVDPLIGWLVLIEMYRPDLTDGYRLTIGLDTIICGNVDRILQYNGDVGLISDPTAGLLELGYKLKKDPRTQVCNAISIFNPVAAAHIWDIYTNKREWVNRTSMLEPFDQLSEMKLLQNCFNRNNQCPRLDWIYMNEIYSYKSHVLKDPSVLQTAKIVYFHGRPKPQELGTYSFNYSIVKYDQKLLEHWI